MNSDSDRLDTNSAESAETQVVSQHFCRDRLCAVIGIIIAFIGLVFTTFLFVDTFRASMATFVWSSSLAEAPTIELAPDFKDKGPIGKFKDLWQVLVALDLSTFSALTAWLWFFLLGRGYLKVLCASYYLRFGENHRLVSSVRKLNKFLDPRPRARPTARVGKLFPLGFPTFCIMLGFLGTIVAFMLAAIASNRGLAEQQRQQQAIPSAILNEPGANEIAGEDAASPQGGLVPGSQSSEPIVHESISMQIFFLIIASLVSTGTAIVVGAIAVPVTEAVDGWLRQVPKDAPSEKLALSSLNTRDSGVAIALREITVTLTANQRQIEELANKRQKQDRRTLAIARRLGNRLSQIEPRLADIADSIKDIPSKMSKHEANLQRATNLLEIETRKTQSARESLTSLLIAFRGPLSLLKKAIASARATIDLIVTSLTDVASSQKAQSEQINDLQTAHASLDTSLTQIALGLKSASDAEAGRDRQLAAISKQLDRVSKELDAARSDIDALKAADSLNTSPRQDGRSVRPFNTLYHWIFSRGDNNDDDRTR